jgi:pimeloyl-ACP methyl ester carboxylesterase
MSSLPVHYAAAAVNRAQRLNFSSGAVWRYPATEKSRGVLLLIHGFRGNHRGLEPIAGALPDWEIFIPDLPGFGATAEPQSISLDEYSQWLIGIYEQMPESTIPIAHSFGTTVLARAMAHGLNPTKAVMINPIAKANYYSADIASKAVKRYYKLGKSKPSILKSKVFIDLMNSVLIKTKAPDLRAWIAKQHLENFSDYTSPRVAIEGFEVASKNSVSDYADRIDTPVLLISGEKDTIGPIAEQRKLQQSFPNAEYYEIPKLGHLLHYEAPDQVAKLIERFLGE